MLAIRTILHPTDFSQHSTYAYGLASALARDYGARLIVLHVVPEPTPVYGEGVVIPANPEVFRIEAREQLERLASPGPEVAVEHRLEDGDPATGILHAAREAGADLIVMATHGRTGLERLLMGSVAEQVVRKAVCPVLTVKAPFPARVPASEEAVPELAKV